MPSKLSRMLLAVVFLFGAMIPLRGRNGNDGLNWPGFRGPNASGVAAKYATNK